MSSVVTDPAKPRRFRLEIEGLRAVAALLVAAYHVWFGRVSGGVDVFFVVAGFMVTTTLLGHLDRTGRIDIGRYLGRLLQRLLPNALLVLAVVAIASWILVPVTRRDEVFTEIAASALYYENWELARRSVDYLERGFTNSPVQHFWAMSIQGQFYLIWLVLFLVLLKVGSAAKVRRRVGVAMAVLVVASFAFSIWFTGVNQPAAYFHTGARVWEFGIGGLLALSAPWWPALGKRWSWGLSWIGLLAIVSCGAVLSVGTSFPGWIALWPVTGAALILLAGHTDARWSASGLLSSTPLVRLGSVSYALYLWHWPLLVFTLVLTEQDQLGLLGGLAVIVAAIALSFASTHLAERPIRSISLHGRRSWSVPLLLTLLVVPVAGTGYAVAADSNQVVPIDTTLDNLDAEVDRDSETQGPGVATGVDSQRYPGALAMDPETSMTAKSENTDEPAPGIAAAPEDLTTAYAEGCHEGVRGEEVKVCEYGDPDADRTMILTGGSHSAHWQPALELIADQRGWRLLMTTKSACKPGTHLATTGSNIETAVSCRKWNAKATAWIQEQNPDLVVLTATVVNRQKASEYLPRGYPLLWEELADEDTEVLAIRDNPRSSHDVPDCLATKGPQDPECDVPSNLFVDEDLTAAFDDEFDNVHFVDLTDYLCEGETCPAVIGNVVVYSDATHLTRSYVRSLAQPLLDLAPVLQ